MPLPGPAANPDQVVRAYIDSVNARDFDTANEIDARPGEGLGRFSRPGVIAGVRMSKTVLDGEEAHVLFSATFHGGDQTIDDGIWGYRLERGSGGTWHIIDEGVT